MEDAAFINKYLADLEAEALRLLDSVATGGREIDGSTLALLENIAEQSARMAFPNHAPLLSVTMGRLIAWTDHLDDEEIRNSFEGALRAYPPLAAPSYYGG